MQLCCRLLLPASLSPLLAEPPESPNANIAGRPFSVLARAGSMANGASWWKPAIAIGTPRGETRLMMRPYWITTNEAMTPGYGIMAYSIEDAKHRLG